MKGAAVSEVSVPLSAEQIDMLAQRVAIERENTRAILKRAREIEAQRERENLVIVQSGEDIHQLLQRCSELLDRITELLDHSSGEPVVITRHSMPLSSRGSSIGAGCGE